MRKANTVHVRHRSGLGPASSRSPIALVVEGGEGERGVFCRWRSLTSGVGLALAVLAVACASMVGCAGTRMPIVEVGLSVDRQEYRIGEPVVAGVRVTNKSESAVFVPSLDADSLKFYWGEPGTGVRMRRDPVLPEGMTGETRILGPGQSASRSFLFTRLTPKVGEYGLMAALNGLRKGGAGGRAMLAQYSNFVSLAVGDEVALERDPNSGIITREQAIALATQQEEPQPGVNVRAVLVPLGETGLYSWAVFLGGEEDSIEHAKGLRVNAYTGVVEPLPLGAPEVEGSGQ